MFKRQRRRERPGDYEGGSPRWPRQWKLLAVWGAPVVLVTGLIALLLATLRAGRWQPWWGWLAALWIVAYLVLLLIARSYDPMPR
jgi:hypothetical protein